VANDFSISDGSSPAESWEADSAQITLGEESNPRAAYTGYGVFLAADGDDALTNADLLLNANGLGVTRVDEKTASHVLGLGDAGKIIEMKQDRTSMVQYLWISGTSISGTFTITINGNTTAPITYSSTLSTLRTNIETALEALLNIGTGNVESVTGDATEADPIAITYTPALGDVGTITLDVTGLSGATGNASFSGFLQYVWLIGATTGDYKLTIGSDTTGAIGFDADSEAVEDALEAISAIGTGNVSVTGAGTGPEDPFVIAYAPSLGSLTEIGAISISDDTTGATYSAAGSVPAAIGTIQLVIPDFADVAFPKGTRIEIVQTGECQIQIVGPFDGPGGTVRTPATTRTAGQWSAAALYKRNTGGDPNDWVLIGDLASA